MPWPPYPSQTYALGRQPQRIRAPGPMAGDALGQPDFARRDLGLTSGNQTRGHRIHAPTPITLSDASQYESLLKTEGFVLADFAARRSLIADLVWAEAAKLGGTAVIDADLLDEVTALVEWPVALAGRFEERFLSVPAEALCPP